METSYSDLAALREALTADDPDDRANAYGDVMEQDVQPSELLGTDPDGAAVQTLVEANVIPESESGGAPGRKTSERDEEIVALLKEIADNTGGA